MGLAPLDPPYELRLDGHEAPQQLGLEAFRQTSHAAIGKACDNGVCMVGSSLIVVREYEVREYGVRKCEGCEEERVISSQ